MPKCDFNKFAKQLYRNHTSAWVFSCKFAAYFQKPFSRNTSWWLLLKLHANDVDIPSSKLLHSYLTKRKERAKINHAYSSW